jgi:uncharacterized protein (TIGR02246 family)
MNKKILLQFSVCIFAGMTLLAGCSSQEGANLEADTAAINDIWTEYASSLNDGDIDRWLSLWTEDGVQMPPNEPPVIGKDQIRVGMKGALDQFTFDIDITNAEVGVAGSWAFSRGTFTRTDTPKEGGQPVFFDGKYMSILERQADGSWKIHRDIFNSNVAPGEN